MAVDGAAALLERTASGTGLAEESSSAVVSLRRRTATGTASAGGVSSGLVSFERRTASAVAKPISAPSREAITASGRNLTGTIASGAAVMRRRSALSLQSIVGHSYGTVRFQERTARGTGASEAIADGLISFNRRRASGHALVGSVASAHVSLKHREVYAIGAPVGVASGAVTLPHRRLVAFSQPEIDSTYRTWVMNTANEALTEYTNFPFNSYAQFNGKLYGAGPNGLIAIEGSDDDGDDISWVIRTGFMDDKKTQLKNLREVLMSIRFDAPIRMRVWTDDSTYYDYTLTNFRDSVIHQARIPTGRGLRSRYYRIELSGMDGAAVEIDSLQVPMEPVARRVG